VPPGQRGDHDLDRRGTIRPTIRRTCWTRGFPWVMRVPSPRFSLTGVRDEEPHPQGKPSSSRWPDRRRIVPAPVEVVVSALGPEATALRQPAAATTEARSACRSGVGKRRSGVDARSIRRLERAIRRCAPGPRAKKSP